MAKIIQLKDTDGNVYPEIYDEVHTNTMTGTYISSGTSYYIQIGKLVVFSAIFTPKQNISTSGSTIDAKLPGALHSGKFGITTLSGDSSSTIERSTLVTSSGGLYPLGAYTAGQTYQVSGAYIAR